MSYLLFILIDLISIIVACLITYYLTTKTVFLNRFRKRRNAQKPTRLNTVTRKFIHEIRNPLNSVSLNLQLLEENLAKLGLENGDNQERAKDLFQRNKNRAVVQIGRISREVNRLKRILKDFGRYTRLPELELQDTDLGKVIEDVINFIEPETKRQNIELIRKIEPLPKVKIDSAQIKQTLINLIINANQAMKDSGKLTISARLSGNQIIIEMEDTGPGIPPEVQEKMFDLFYSTKEDGTGVGLAIAKQVVEGHGGRVNIKSQVGKGTKVIIFLPI